MPKEIASNVGIDVAFATIGLLLSTWSIGIAPGIGTFVLDVVAFTLCAYAFYDSAKNLVSVKRDIHSGLISNTSPKYILYLTTFISGCGLTKSIWDVATGWPDD